MTLLIAATDPPRTTAQLFPFTSLRHIFDNLKIRGAGGGGGGNVARIYSEHDASLLPPPRSVAAATLVPLSTSASSTATSQGLFSSFDPEVEYRKLDQNRSKHFTPIPIPTSNTSDQKPTALAELKRSQANGKLPPVPSSFLQPPPKDLSLKIDLSEVTKLAAENIKKVKVKQTDTAAASSQDVPKNHKIPKNRKVPKNPANHRLETTNLIPTNHKRAPSINTPRKHLPSTYSPHTITVEEGLKSDSDGKPHGLMRKGVPPIAPVHEPESSATHLEVPPGGEDRVEFQMHGLQGPKSYKFGFDTGKGQHRQFRYEERDSHGYVRGHYGYVDDDGKLQVVNYKADPHTGYHADVSKLQL